VRFEIDSRTTDGLRVIPEIPDIHACMLEGQNGIGKTVAVQLLELVSGQIPEALQTRPISGFLCVTDLALPRCGSSS